MKPDSKNSLMINLLLLLIVTMLSLVMGCRSGNIHSGDQDALGTDFPSLDGCNIIMISLDTLRQDHLGMYGYNRNVSPFLDYVSRRALLFSNVFSQSPATNSSHYSLFTSRYISNPHDPRLKNEHTLAGILQLQGWRTHAITAGGMLSPNYMKDKGFQTFDSQRQDFNVILDKARCWLSDLGDKRFFLFLHTYQIHPPFNPHPDYHKLFRDSYNPQMDLQRMGIKALTASPLTENDYSYLKGAYDAKIRYCDALIEKFAAFLKRSGLNQKTVLVIISDHGESIGERDYVGHCQLYEVQLRVPLIILLPGDYGRIINEPVENIDIVPTLFSLFRLPVPAFLQGKNLTPLLYKSPGNEANRFRISEYDSRSIRSENGWKLIVRGRPDQDELYFLPSDPNEINNLARQNPEKVTELTSEMKGIMGASEDQLRKPITRFRVLTNVMGGIQTKEDNDIIDQLQELGYID
ncbi:sulfatase [bacterium]|nr:sulfatase [bacterium]